MPKRKVKLHYLLVFDSNTNRLMFIWVYKHHNDCVREADKFPKTEICSKKDLKSRRPKDFSKESWKAYIQTVESRAQ